MQNKLYTNLFWSFQHVIVRKYYIEFDVGNVESNKNALSRPKSIYAVELLHAVERL